MSGKNKHRSANDYLQYLKGELSNQERHAFEKGLEADPFEQEAMEGLESLETGQTEQDILYLHNRLRKRLSRRRRVAFYSVAATVASLLIVGTVFLKIHDFNPSSDEKQVYPEESFDSGTPSEAQPSAPAQNEVEVFEPASPSPERSTEVPPAAPIHEREPAKGESKGRSKGEKEIKVFDDGQRQNLDMLRKRAAECGKPVLVVTPVNDPETNAYLLREKIPVFTSPHRAARVLHHLTWYRGYLDANQS
jgi:hypothetical protein